MGEIDPEREAVLLLSKDGIWESKAVAAYRSDGRLIHITFSDDTVLRYGVGRVSILRDPVSIPLDPDERIFVRGSMWTSRVELRRFEGPGGGWLRVSYTTMKAGRKHLLYPESEVRIVRNPVASTRAVNTLEYWRKLVSFLPEDDALRWPYAVLKAPHHDSALARYLTAGTIDRAEPAAPLIAPYSSNLSQHQALETALTNPVSVIEGPPGTGKTQTILNIVASVVTAGMSVGVVSFNNAAVDNVRTKLEEEGIGFIAANLGRKAKKEEFFDREAVRNRQIYEYLSGPPEQMPSMDEVTECGRRLRELQFTERWLRQLEQELDAYRLEFRHFQSHLDRQVLPEMKQIPLLQKSSGRILDYLAETQFGHLDEGTFQRLARRISGYFKYGSTKDVDPTDTEVVLRLQKAFYVRKLSELQGRITKARDRLAKDKFEDLAQNYKRLSTALLHAHLQERFAARPRRTFTAESYKESAEFREFISDCPVILSTCHSLRSSIPKDFLLDYLIIDEASQVNLLAAGLSLASCRNLVVVGDLNQLQHIADTTACKAAGPAPIQAYDYEQHNILSSLVELYGDDLPSTLLQEHYRCHPAIIGFCNRKFYGNRLIPYTSSLESDRPLIVVRTAEGNHMREHWEGGRSNQREIDVIDREVIPTHCVGTPKSEIGVTTPYRIQANKAGHILDAAIEADTVHKFQGRAKDIVIMTTVLDESKQGNMGVKFVDDPKLVNVALSRARKRFILVTNNGLLPRSRNLRNLIEYIRYYDPAHEVEDSQVISVFDLLYREYSDRLRTLSHRLQEKTRFKSENIAWTLLNDILGEKQYSDLHVVCQVRVRDMLPDLNRLSTEEAKYVKHRSSFDFLVYNSITNKPVLAIEVDGFKYHENKPEQLVRDHLKDLICGKYELPILRLPTTGSDEERLIRQKLDEVH
jgi:RecA/RadA recombinase